MEQQVLECLTATLSEDSNTRMAAELELARLFTDPATALAIASIVATPAYDITVRQIAVIALRKYVKERWSPYFATFKGNAPPVEIKAQIRQAVFSGLSASSSKIRSACAHTISSIANCDWPDEYPDLLESLIILVSSSNPDGVHGAMQVFAEFIKSDLSEDQILPVLRQLLPVLLNILGSAQYTPMTRARAVSVVRQCLSALYMVKEQYPQAVKEATDSVLPVWIEAFKVLLKLDVRNETQNESNWGLLAIRVEIFKTLDTILTSFPRSLSPHLADLLTCSLDHLNAVLPTFIHYYITTSEPVPNTSDEEPVELPTLACPIMDFVAGVVRTGKAKTWLEPSVVENLLRAVFGWVQMSSEDEDNWANDANAFVAQEYDDNQSYSLRVAGLDLLSCLAERLPTVTIRALSESINRVVSESHHARESGDSEWWRPVEAALASLGSISENVTEFLEDEDLAGRPKPIDITLLLTEVVPALLSLSECPFLQGRSFVFASQYGKLLPAQLAGQYLEAAIEVIETAEAGIPIKVSAVKAIQNFCGTMDDSVLVPLAPRIARDIGPFILLTSEDSLSLVLDTMSSVVEVDSGKWISTELAEALVKANLQVWTMNNRDPIVISILGDIIGTIAGAPTPGVFRTAVAHALPPLCTALAASDPKESWVPSSAIEIISCIVNNAPGPGLGEGFVAGLAPSLFHCLHSAEDRDVLQNGVTCVTRIIRKDCQQLVDWKDSDGKGGIDHVLALVAKLLNNEDESGGLPIGDLIINLLRRTISAVIPILPDLLQAMVRRMVTAKTASFVQSLVIPFAYLIQAERDTVLALLETTDVNGRSGLDILIQTWCENAETFQGFWPSRVSTLGLCQLLAAERPSLQNLMVKGDLIVNPETADVIITRSKAKQMPHEFTSLPFPVKATKILIHNLQTDHPGGMPHQVAKGDADSDDGDDEWADEDKIYQASKDEEFAFLSDMLRPHDATYSNDDIMYQDDDEDLKNDPISQMDMKAHTISFIRECAQRNTNNFSQIVSQLNTLETLVIQKIVSEQ